MPSLDWIGLDAYPGTFFPTGEIPSGTTERDWLVNALTSLRCFAKIPGIPKSVPIHVQENGYPTGAPPRTEERQAQMLRGMVDTFHDYRGTYNVTDYRWFNLRDAESGSPNFQQQYGIMKDDYTPKPAFFAYQGLIDRLSVRNPPPRLSLTVRLQGRSSRRAGCARSGVEARVHGPDRGEIDHVDFLLGGRYLGRDERAPFERHLTPPRGRRERTHTVTARVRLLDERRVTLSRSFRACASQRGGRRGAPRFTG